MNRRTNFIFITLLSLFFTTIEPVFYGAANSIRPDDYLQTNNYPLHTYSSSSSLFNAQCATMRASVAQQKRTKQLQEDLKKIAAQHEQAKQNYVQKISTDQHSSTTQNYVLDAPSQAFIEHYDTTPYTQFSGTSEHHDIHKKLLTIIHEAAHLPTHHAEIAWYKDQIGTTCALAHEANTQKSLALATHLTDLAQGLLSCAKAVALGIGDGIVHTAQAITHPIETVKNIALGVRDTARALVNILHEVGLLASELIIDRSAAHTRLHSYYDNILWFKNIICSMPKETLLRQAAALGTEAILLQKTIGLAAKLCDHGLTKAVEIAQKVASKTPYMVAEGVPIQIAHQASEYMYNMATEVPMRGKPKTTLLPALSPGYASLKDELTELSLRLSHKSKCVFPFKHIFEPEIRTYTHANGTITTYVSGWHHDYKKAILRKKLFNGHKIEFLKKTIGKHGVYKLDWKISGTKEKTSTFFPAKWSRNQVIKKINEAERYYAKNKTFIDKKINRNNETISFHGYTSEGIKIRIIKNKNNKIITAYPEM